MKLIKLNKLPALWDEVFVDGKIGHVVRADNIKNIKVALQRKDVFVPLTKLKRRYTNGSS